MQESEGELHHSAQEVREVLVEHEGLNAREDGEGETLEHLLEPHLVGRTPVDLGHSDF